MSAGYVCHIVSLGICFKKL